MPTADEYRRHSVDTFTHALADAAGNIDHDGAPAEVLEAESAHPGLAVDVPSDPTMFADFLQREVSTAIAGVGVIVVTLLEYLTTYSNQGLDAAGWLARAAADIELRQDAGYGTADASGLL
jgi:hypothetical protein